MALAVAAFVGLDVWLFFVHGISQSLRHTLYNPALMLVLLGGVVLATAFHEIGHATGCRYGGAKPGVMGVGIYIVWPAFYTDITDAYRLGKWGRLRTDIGGMYFNAIFALAIGGAYALTGFEPLLLLVVLQTFAIVQQSLPFLRLDGYYIISDLTGVPDILLRIKPVLLSLVPGPQGGRPRDRAQAVGALRRDRLHRPARPGDRPDVPLMIINAPRLFATGWDSFWTHYDMVGPAFDKGQTMRGIQAALQMVVLALPAIGFAYTLIRVAARGGRGAWSWSAGSAVRRAGVALAGSAAVAAIAFTWWPNGEYKPIQPGERGTLTGAIEQIKNVTSGRASLTPQRRAAARRSAHRAAAPRQARQQGKTSQKPSSTTRKVKGRSTATTASSAASRRPRRHRRVRSRRTETQRRHNTQTTPQSSSPQPDAQQTTTGTSTTDQQSTTADVHRSAATTPDDANHTGDTMRRLAALTVAFVLSLSVGAQAAGDTGPNNVVNVETTGTSVTDTQSALKVGHYGGDNLQSENVASAYSHDCTDCRTVAVAVQAVLVTGNPSTSEPKNVAAALNQNCVRCTTFAYAYQYVVNTDGRVHLDGETRADIHRAARRDRRRCALEPRSARHGRAAPAAHGRVQVGDRPGHRARRRARPRPREGVAPGAVAPQYAAASCEDSTTAQCSGRVDGNLRKRDGERAARCSATREEPGRGRFLARRERCRGPVRDRSTRPLSGALRDRRVRGGSEHAIRSGVQAARRGRPRSPGGRGRGSRRNRAVAVTSRRQPPAISAGADPAPRSGCGADLGRAEGAAARRRGDLAQALGALARAGRVHRRLRAGTREQRVHGPDHEEEHHRGDDHKGQQRVEEVAVAEGAAVDREA